MSGFSRDTLRFLRDLASHNDRAWFAANKERYERCVVEPALAFIEAMAPELARVAPRFTCIAKRTGGSLIRIFRDTRFGGDKRPYKTNVGIQFRHARGRDIHAPGFYVHVEPGGCFLGAGIWRPEPQALRAIRTEIAERPDEWSRAIGGRAFRRHFELGGERLQRPPRGFPADAPHAEHLKRKDFVASADLADGDVASARLAKLAAERFAAAAPLVAFLCGALDLEF